MVAAKISRRANIRKVGESMYTENNFMTPRERVNEALQRRMPDNPLSSQQKCPSCTGNGERSSAVGRDSWGLIDYPLASMFAPLQEWRSIYDLEGGFDRGTIFKELDLPFLCGDRKGGNACGR